jgi:nucleoside-diphosphate-sugar epimerase
MAMRHLVVFGLGYSGGAVAAAAVRLGWRTTLVSRTPRNRILPPNAACVAFGDAAEALADATHLLATAPPDEPGDPVLAVHSGAIASAPRLGWIGYLSTTGVYGDRDGGWVDEDTPPSAASTRAARRIQAEQAWVAAGQDRSAGRPAGVDLFRLAGIYGPGRSPFAEVMAGRAFRVRKPGHAFGRIHRDDIVQAVIAAIMRPAEGRRVLNLVDNLPAERADVLAEAARLLGAPLPPEVPYEQAIAGMSAMARSFWAENRKVASLRTQARLSLRWRYRDYFAGLRATLAEEIEQGLHRPA